MTSSNINQEEEGATVTREVECWVPQYRRYEAVMNERGSFDSSQANSC